MRWFILLLLIPYIYIILKIFRNLSGIKPFTAVNTSSLFVTIIIAARNEEAKLPFLLNDISSQDYPSGSYEVIVIDDNSTDGTFDTVAAYRGISNLRIYKNPGSGKKAAIRTGAGEASGELIITVDADCRVNNKWIGTIASFYEKECPGMIISPVMLSGGPGFFHRFQELEFLSLQGITAGTALAGDPVMCNGANLSFRKELYERYSSFLHDELISGDDVFLLHSMKKDSRIRILWLESENAIVTSGTSSSFGSFMNQRARWISKYSAYTDFSIKATAIITLTAVSVQIFSLIAGIVEPEYLTLFASALLLKSVPDYILLRNITTRYRKYSLIRWFPVSQLIYPFYVIAVIITFIRGRKKNR